MEEVLYLDSYFLLNFVMDFTSLALAGLIASEKARLFRLVLAALFGSAVSLCLLFVSLFPLLDLLFAFLSFFPMIFIAFSPLSLRRSCAVSLFAFLSSLFLGGAVEVISYYTSRRGKVTLFVFLAVLFLALGAFTLWGRRLKGRLDSAVISLSIVNEGREEQLFGLLDSGSFLREPTGGAPVILLKAEYAAGLLSPQRILDLRDGVGERVYPVPLKTASGRGCLFGFFPQAVYLHLPRKGRRGKSSCEKVLIALDFSGGGYGGCPCLVPLSVL